ncbi:MAG: Holliday junction resolvase RuvX [Christensenellaceae bacterium]|jgi:putative Holliday junction resolvase|nr:Holliday junction resolvase RuvX [Christensenellaceae bacterium]
MLEPGVNGAPKERAVLALDVGSVRIGVAGTDALGITAQGIETWARKGLGGDLAHLCDLASARGAKAFVVGLPLNMNGSFGPQAEETQAFAEALFQKSGLPVIYVDERLTSRAAHGMLHEAGLRQRKHKGIVDKLAAVLILESYLGRL